MKTTLGIASFALITALSSFSTTHAAGFNDQSVVPNATTAVQTGQQDLRHVHVVQSFNEQSHLPATAFESTASTGRAPAIAGRHCDPTSSTGFQKGTSFVASC